MVVRWLLLCVALTAAAVAEPEVVEVPPYHDNCGCLLVCSDRYNPEYAIADNAVGGGKEEELAKEREACHRGCLFYHSVISEQDHGRIPAHLERQYTHDKCLLKCSSSLSGKAGEEAACKGGCRDGCLYFPHSAHGRRPSMRLTIVVEETIRRQPISPPISQDVSEGIESLLTDPGLKQQIEDTQSPTDVKTKIPSSYFTNMPVTHHTRPQLCGDDENECDGWILGEPVVCAALLILAAGLLLLAYYTHNTSATNEAPPLPEKLPPPYMPLPSPPYSC